MATHKPATIIKPSTDEEKFLKLGEVMSLCKRSRSSVYNAIKSGTFPAPVKIGVRSSAWVKSEITAWIDGCISNSRTKN